jgi:hypothetical protein
VGSRARGGPGSRCRGAEPITNVEPKNATGTPVNRHLPAVLGLIRGLYAGACKGTIMKIVLIAMLAAVVSAPGAHAGVLDFLSAAAGSAPAVETPPPAAPATVTVPVKQHYQHGHRHQGVDPVQARYGVEAPSVPVLNSQPDDAKAQDIIPAPSRAERRNEVKAKAAAKARQRAVDKVVRRLADKPIWNDDDVRAWDWLLLAH